jgi:hypothetical protein
MNLVIGELEATLVEHGNGTNNCRLKVKPGISFWGVRNLTLQFRRFDLNVGFENYWSSVISISSIRCLSVRSNNVSGCYATGSLLYIKESVSISNRVISNNPVWILIECTRPFVAGLAVLRFENSFLDSALFLNIGPNLSLIGCASNVDEIGHYPGTCKTRTTEFSGLSGPKTHTSVFSGLSGFKTCTSQFSGFGIRSQRPSESHVIE